MRCPWRRIALRVEALLLGIVLSIRWDEGPFIDDRDGSLYFDALLRWPRWALVTVPPGIGVTICALGVLLT